MSDKKMVTGVFRNRYDAETAYSALRGRGYLPGEINVLMSDRTRETYANPSEAGKLDSGSKSTEGLGVGGAIGTAVGAALAAVAAIGTTIMVPGLGIVVAGPIVAALAGGGAGAVTGGVLGALIGAGIPESNASAYEAALKDGGVVIGVVPRNSDEADAIEEEFRQMHGENVCTC
jgi:hypothetical protein